MAFISIRGVEHYYEWITADATAKPSGKPVMVFLHGWAGSARYWESTARAIAGEFDCLLYDMRGFGRSPLPSEPPESSYELETYAHDLAQLLAALNLSRVYLNAHSTGASIATLFLNLYPEKVEKAILTCSGIFEYDEKAFTTFHKFGGYVVKFRPRWLASIPFVDRIFMARFLHRSLPSDARKAFLLDFLMADEAAAIGTMVTAVSKKAAEEMPQEFARLSVPTLLVAGEFDRIIPAIMGEQAASFSKKVEFVIIPNTAHFPMLEDAATYLQRIRDFLPATA